MRDGVVIKRSDGLETRRRVLDAAGRVFAARGFRDATVADICRSAGANVAAVNYHFGSKRKLYVEAWRHAFHRSMAAYPPDVYVRPHLNSFGALEFWRVREIIAHVEKDKDNFKRALERRIEAFAQHEGPSNRAEDR